MSRAGLGLRLDRCDPGARSVPVTPEVKEHLWSALTSLASAPVSERTITGLSVLLQSNDLKQALRPYCVGGPYGRLLDAEAEHLGSANVQVFETEGLIGTGAAPPFSPISSTASRTGLDGRPTLLIVDEGWLALDDEGFAGQLREWLKTLRKKNASVIFATQSLSDIDGSAIAPAIIESCQTRILLPNERAIEPQITAIYRRFGLNDRQIEILARAMPKRDYYCQSRRGNRLFELGLSDVALALCAASSKQRSGADRRASTPCTDADGFPRRVACRKRDVGWAADLIPTSPTSPLKPIRRHPMTLPFIPTRARCACRRAPCRAARAVADLRPAGRRAVDRL
jgi:type IV secretory pathway VirB4 component